MEVMQANGFFPFLAMPMPRAPREMSADSFGVFLSYLPTYLSSPKTHIHDAATRAVLIPLSKGSFCLPFFHSTMLSPKISYLGRRMFRTL